MTPTSLPIRKASRDCCWSSAGDASARPAAPICGPTPAAEATFALYDQPMTLSATHWPRANQAVRPRTPITSTTAAAAKSP